MLTKPTASVEVLPAENTVFGEVKFVLDFI